MKRVISTPREDWEKKVNSVGLTFAYTRDPNDPTKQRQYWDEGVRYEFSMAEVDKLEAVTNELWDMFVAAGQYVIDNDLFGKMGIPPQVVPLIKWAWDAEPPSIYGRYDFAWDGTGEPKLLEFNADTPTGLVEAAVAQWYWLEDLFPDRDRFDQFTSLHEKLIAKWADIKAYLRGKVLYFSHAKFEDTEDQMTTDYLMDTAVQAGIECRPIIIENVGWDSGNHFFVDEKDEEIKSIFKLYPWEWLIHEPFGEHALDTYRNMQWIEPIWKMLWSNKGILAVLWKLYPDHPNLLPAFFDGPGEMKYYAKKPLLGREGNNVTLVTPQGEVTNGGDYGEEGFVFQAYCPLPNFDGFYPLIGSWVVVDQGAAGIGIREAETLITGNYSRFVPHVIVK